MKHRLVIIDGYIGVFYDHFRERLDTILKNSGLTTSWKTTSDFLKSPAVIEKMISPFMGGDDPLFGNRATLDIEDFFDREAIKEFSS